MHTPDSYEQACSARVPPHPIQMREKDEDESFWYLWSHQNPTDVVTELQKVMQQSALSGSQT